MSGLEAAGDGGCCASSSLRWGHRASSPRGRPDLLGRRIASCTAGTGESFPSSLQESTLFCDLQYWVMYLTCGGQGGHVDPVRRYGRSRGAGVGVLGLLVHVQAHVVAVFLGTDWTGEVLPHWVQWVHTIAIGCHQRRTKMQ